MSRTKIEWIDIKKKLPKKPCRVLVFRPGDDFGSFGEGFYTVTVFTGKGSFFQGETHWAPLPEPPKQD